MNFRGILIVAIFAVDRKVKKSVSVKSILSLYYYITKIDTREDVHLTESAKISNHEN